MLRFEHPRWLTCETIVASPLHMRMPSRLSKALALITIRKEYNMAHPAKPAFCSWSGGKDSCLALYRAIQEGYVMRFLFTMLSENGDKSRSHGLSIDVLKAQSQALGIPLVLGAATWEGYEERFAVTLRGFRDSGIRTGIFGDIDIEGHREWVERVCASSEMEAYLPLWRFPRLDLLDEFLGSGFKAILVSIKEGTLDRSLLGRVLSRDLVREIEGCGVDACGEQGEFHTVVTAGPLFTHEVHINLGDQVLHDGYWFQEVSLRD